MIFYFFGVGFIGAIGRGIYWGWGDGLGDLFLCERGLDKLGNA